MTVKDWVLSALIFVIAVVMLDNFFLSLTLWESIVLTIFVAICIFHTVDVREDFMKKYEAKKRAQNGYTGPERRNQHRRTGDTP